MKLASHHFVTGMIYSSLHHLISKVPHAQNIFLSFCDVTVLWRCDDAMPIGRCFLFISQFNFSFQTNLVESLIAQLQDEAQIVLDKIQDLSQS